MRRTRSIALAATCCLLHAACSNEPTPERTNPDVNLPAATGPCADRSLAAGELLCVHEVIDAATWGAVSVPTAGLDMVRATKFIAPVSGEAALPLTFQVASRHASHVDFLGDVFPELFPALGVDEYASLTLDPSTRSYVAGTLAEHLTLDGATVYSFTVWEDADPDTAEIDASTLSAVATRIAEAFTLADVTFMPTSDPQRAAAEANALSVYEADASLAYEVYAPGVTYGVVRHVPADALSAVLAGDLSFQDLLVLDQAPVDLTKPIAGAVVGTRQGELSHLAVRSANRGTPYCYRRDAADVLAAWEGTLVRLECRASALVVRAASVEEADAWWQDVRPEPVPIPAVDAAWTDSVRLTDIPVDSADARRAALARYGGKGARLALLYQRVDTSLQLDGFALPFHWYERFVDENTWTPPDTGAEESFRDSLARWLDDPGFTSDPTVRGSRLKALRDAMRQGTVPDGFLDDVTDRVREVWGRDDVMIRLRSSSNAEDDLRFSGAGLYDSESACLADSLAEPQPVDSLCDDDSGSRTIERAALRVWASLWTDAAYDERAWFGVDQSAVSMALAVNTRSEDERANFVAFSGNPSRAGDGRVVINAQLGEGSAVSPAPGEVLEKTIVDLDATPVVSRVRASNLVPAGTWVVSDAHAQRVGQVLRDLETSFEIDQAAPPDTTILLDTEWKVLVDGRLILKQARPFLRDDASLTVLR